MSSKTKPTELEAREALARLLMRGKPPAWIPRVLALHFWPVKAQAPFYQRTVVFKQISKGHARPPLVDLAIATRVKALRDMGMSYEEATRSVAELDDRDERHIKKIYTRYKDLFTKKPRLRLVSSDKRSNDMKSDR